MNLKTKKIIAREGLILIPSLIWFALFLSGALSTKSIDPQLESTLNAESYYMALKVSLLPVLVYLIRFVIWGIKTLKEK